jgi:hypothetical protein
MSGVELSSGEQLRGELGDEFEEGVCQHAGDRGR